MENGPGENSTLLAVFISEEGRGLGGAGTAQQTCPVNSTLHVYFFRTINVTCVNTRESNTNILKILKQQPAVPKDKATQASTLSSKL